MCLWESHIKSEIEILSLQEKLRKSFAFSGKLLISIFQPD